MAYQPSYNQPPYTNTPIPFGQPVPSEPVAPAHTSYPGHGPPPPIPANHPNAAPPHPYQPQYYPPPSGPPPPMPQFPGHEASPQFPQGAYPPPPLQPQHSPMMYLGAAIPDPLAPPPPHGAPLVVGYDPSVDTEAIRKATKGFGTNDILLISTLIPLDAMKMHALAQFFVAKTGKRIADVLESETSSWFRMGIHGLVMGPLAWDIELVHQALAGAGTNETALTELILGRPSAELRLLIAGYRHTYGHDLVDKIRGDLSGKTERLFIMALNANRPPDSIPVNQADIAKDVDALYKAGQGKLGTDEMMFCEILINRSQPHLTAMIGAYAKKHKSLTKVIKSEFSGHMRSGLLHIVEGAKPKRDGQGVWRDAKLLDKAMVGFGTKDAQLVWRIVRGHWDPKRMEAVKEAYARRGKKSLEARVASETSGSYKKLMVALVQGVAAGAKK